MRSVFLALVFAKSRLQLLRCSLPSGIPQESVRYQTISQETAHAILRNLEPLPSIGVDVAAQLLDDFTHSGLHEESKTILVDCVNSKADIDGDLQHGDTTDSRRQKMEWPENYFTESEWSMMRTGYEVAIKVIVKKIIDLRMLHWTEKSIAKFAAVGQWALGEYHMTRALQWRDDIKKSANILKRNVEEPAELVMEYPEDPLELSSTHPALYAACFMQAGPICTPEDFGNIARLFIMKGVSPCRVQRGQSSKVLRHVGGGQMRALPPVPVYSEACAPVRRPRRSRHPQLHDVPECHRRKCCTGG